ncbi:MAG TPA: flagellar hook protein FlgE [Armatimonadota bacterium]|jgi:flagellar hook protein FlgE
MLQSMFSGASGLRAHQTQMDVIGNNIANINTVGFKSSRAEFKQALARTMRGATAPGVGSSGGTDPLQVGLGVTVGAIGTLQTQGSLQYTGRSLDVAIEGNGLLVLSDGSNQLYTRDGSLTVNSDGTLTTSGAIGYRVMGWNANSTTGQIDPTGGLQEIKMPVGQWSLARQTSAVTFGGNLDSSTATGGSVATSYKIYDSLGTSHTLQVSFTKTANPGEWTYTATSPDGTFGATGTGTVTFDTNGKITGSGVLPTTMTLTAPGGANATIPIDLNVANLSSLSGNGQSTITPTAQNGLPLGTLTGYSIDTSGIVSGAFSNGMTQAIAQISVANFTNPNGLEKLGGNVFGQSANSGLPQAGTPMSGGRGKLTANNLEMSNVDLSTEFTSMIVAQRGFQANSRIVTTSDEMLQDLMSMKR